MSGGSKAYAKLASSQTIDFVQRNGALGERSVMLTDDALPVPLDELDGHSLHALRTQVRTRHPPSALARFQCLHLPRSI